MAEWSESFWNEQAPVDRFARKAWLRRNARSLLGFVNTCIAPSDIEVADVMDRVLAAVEAGIEPATIAAPPPRAVARRRVDAFVRAAAHFELELTELRDAIAGVVADTLTPAEREAKNALALAKLDAQAAKLKSRPVRRAPAASLSGRYISPALSKPRFISTALVDVPPADDLPENVVSVESRRRIQSGSFWLNQPPPRPAVVLDFSSRHSPSSLEHGAVYRTADGKLFVRQRPEQPKHKGRRRDDDDGIDPKAKAKSEAYFAERRARWEERRLERMERKLNEDDDDA